MNWFNRKFLTAILIMTVNVTGLCQTQVKGDFKAEYKILTEKNIFSKDRSAPVSSENNDFKHEQEGSATNSELRYVLRGISSVDEKWAAFFEDMITGLCSIVHVNDNFSEGKIVKISKEEVLYEIQDQQRKILIGADLAGINSSLKANITNTSMGTESPPSSEESDILKKLMERRKKQLNQ